MNIGEKAKEMAAIENISIAAARRIIVDFIKCIFYEAQVEGLSVVKGLGTFKSATIKAQKRYIFKEKRFKYIPQKKTIRFKVSKKVRKDLNNG